jgi:hypothetical protein
VGGVLLKKCADLVGVVLGDYFCPIRVRHKQVKVNIEIASFSCSVEPATALHDPGDGEESKDASFINQ